MQLCDAFDRHASRIYDTHQTRPDILGAFGYSQYLSGGPGYLASGLTTISSGQIVQLFMILPPPHLVLSGTLRLSDNENIQVCQLFVLVAVVSWAVFPFFA